MQSDIEEEVDLGDIDSFVSNKLVVESGRDTEGRPIFAFYAMRFPDPKDVDYDELLKALFRKLDDYVRNDYVIVFFSEPLKYLPKLGWMIDAYKKLSRDYKKNVQKMFIVHPSWWFKIVLGFMQKVVSSKFAAKMELVEKLSLLPDLVPCEEIDIPQEIIDYNEKVNPGDKMQIGEREDQPKDDSLTSKSMNKKRSGRRKEKLFGKDMSLVTAGAVETPDPILSLIMYIKTNGVDDESLFRKSPPANEIAELKDRLDNDMEVQWSNFDIPTLAGLLKAYVRELPDPLIPQNTYIHLNELTRMDTKSVLVEYIKTSLSQMSEQPLELLKEIIDLLKVTLAHAARNKMSMKSIVTVWTPNLIRHDDLEEEMRRMRASQKLVECLIEYYDDLF